MVEDEDEEEEDAAALEEELRQRLAEYKRYKEAAAALAELAAARARYGLRPVPLTGDGPVVAPGPAGRLSRGQADRSLRRSL